MHSQIIRRNVWDAFNRTCVLCGHYVDWTTCTVEHLIPKVNGGTDSRDNLAPTHYVCNRIKGTGSLVLAAKKIKSKLSKLSSKEASVWLGRKPCNNLDGELTKLFNDCCVVCGLHIERTFVVEKITDFNVFHSKVNNRGPAHNKCHQLRKLMSIIDASKLVHERQESYTSSNFQKWLNSKYV